MHLRFCPAIFSLLLLTSCGPTESKKIERANEPDVFELDGADPGMKAAVAKAKGSLAEFDAAFKSGNNAYSHFAVKQSFDLPQGREEMWVSNVVMKGDNYSGILLNHPLHVKNLEKGDSLVVSKEKVVDWMYVYRDTMRGGFTKRLLRSRLSEADRAKFDKQTEYVVEDYRR